jgi:hypothetical protein
MVAPALRSRRSRRFARPTRRATALAGVLALAVLPACSDDGEGADGGDGGSDGSGAVDGGTDDGEVGISPPEPACADATQLTVIGPSADPVELSDPAAYAVVVGPEARIVVTTADVSPSEVTSGAEPVLEDGEIWVEVTLTTTGDASPQPGLYEPSGDDETATELISDLRVLVGPDELPVDGPAELALDVLDSTGLCGTLYVESGEAVVTVEGDIVASRLA